MKIIEYDVEDKEIYYIQEFYRDEYYELQQGIMYLANADDREINFKSIINYCRLYCNRNTWFYGC